MVTAKEKKLSRRKQVNQTRKVRQTYRKANVESAGIILTNQDQYGGDGSLMVEWANKILRKGEEMPRQECVGSRRLKAFCDGCGARPEVLHLPAKRHGWYCGACCPVCARRQNAPETAGKGRETARRVAL
jgi:hypothetical protein